MDKLRFFLALVTLCVVTLTHAQYWIGPKAGYHYTLHDYQEPTYDQTYNISDTHSWQAGMVVTYQASDRYAVHGELFFENQKNRVRSNDGFAIDSKSSFNFLSVPILFRVSMGHTPVHWYLNAGPKISYWLGGKGEIFSEELSEALTQEDQDALLNNDGFLEYDLEFKAGNVAIEDIATFWVPDANRIQYSLTAGGGFYLDLANGGRMMFDFRYNWGHSNMGFNIDLQDNNGKALIQGSELDIPESGYVENYEFSMSSISFSIAYMFEYNAQLKRRGSSTSSNSQSTKKSANKKKKKANK